MTPIGTTPNILVPSSTVKVGEVSAFMKRALKAKKTAEQCAPCCSLTLTLVFNV